MSAAIEPRRASLVIFGLVVLASLGCDQLTKDIAREELSGAGPSVFLLSSEALGEVARVEFSLATNAGGFLSLGGSMPAALRTLVFVVASPLLLVVLCGMLLRQARVTRWDVVCSALLAGGGAGNWLDRVFRDGLVTDFLRVGAGPVSTGIFNVADVAIMAGAFGLFIAHWRAPDAPDSPEERAQDSARA